MSLRHWVRASIGGMSRDWSTNPRVAKLPSAWLDACVRRCRRLGYEYPDIPAALVAARADAVAKDRILAFGSFHVVAPVLREIARV